MKSKPPFQTRCATFPPRAPAHVHEHFAAPARERARAYPMRPGASQDRAGSTAAGRVLKDVSAFSALRRNRKAIRKTPLQSFRTFRTSSAANCGNCGKAASAALPYRGAGVRRRSDCGVSNCGNHSLDPIVTKGFSRPSRLTWRLSILSAPFLIHVLRSDLMRALWLLSSGSRSRVCATA